MLEISNLDDGKSEWNMNETHIIIPVIDGDIIAKDSEKPSKNTITLNNLDGGDQTVMTNGLEHSLVIGLDRNLFETHANKSDLLVIQNSDLKLLSCNSDSKVAYALSYIDQDRSEIIWESSILKDRTKSEWCSTEKPIFEVKDVLNYDESAQDSSKNWQDELDRNNDQINLNDMSGGLSTQVAKIDGGILIPVEDVSVSKKLASDIDGDSHFVVNYYPIQGCETISMLPNSTVVTKQIESSSKKSIIIKNESLIENELLVNATIKETCTASKWNKNKEILNEGVCEPVLISPEEYNEESVPNANGCAQYEIKDFVEESQVQSVKNYKSERRDVNNGVRSCLPEKSLPLKKKAKMKRTLTSSAIDNLRLASKQEVHPQKKDSEVTEKKSKLQSFQNLQQNNPSSSDSDEPLINKVSKRKKSSKPDTQFESVGEDIVSNYLVNGLNSERDAKTKDNMVGVDKSEEEKGSKSLKLSDGTLFGLDKRKFKTIYELVEGLKKYRLINASVWQILHSGLKEMNVDILKEMNTKRKEKSSGGSLTYSTHLKAFALVLYFKQPAAFNYLAKLYRSGWPSLEVIKDWKQRLNTHQRPDFVGLKRNSEDIKS